MICLLAVAGVSAFAAGALRSGERETRDAEHAARERDSASRVASRDAAKRAARDARDLETHVRWLASVARKSTPGAVDAVAKLAIAREEAKRLLRKSRKP